MATKGSYVEASTPKKKGKKILDRVEIKEAETGGHVVRHMFHHDGPEPMYHEPEEHVFGKSEGGKLLDHLTTHLHIKHKDSGSEAEEDEE